jgi:predicted metalloprotease with PDZ domain
VLFEGDTALIDADRVAADVQKIVDAGKSVMGSLPYPHYHFLSMVTESSGALEHKNSYLGMTNRFATRTHGAYMSFLGTLAHEYFHNWNVKRLRPVELGPFDYENENYVKTLWVAEGFTDYYSDILPARGGIETKEEFLDGISNQIEQVQTIPGRLVTPVNMASFDTWIKQYRPDENTANVSINYYPKGAVIAFLLDAKIRRATSGARSLDTGMQWAMQRYSGDKGYTGHRHRVALRRRGIRQTIPKLSTEDRSGPFDRDTYRRRHLVENLFARCKQYRALATRYDKRAESFRAAWVIVMTILWLPG